MEPMIMILGVIVWLAYTTETLTGFGSNVVAVTLGAHVYPIHHLVPVMVSLNVFVTGYIAFRYRKDIAFDLLLRRIYPFMALGLVIGLFLYPVIRGMALKKLLGVLVFVFAARELFSLLRKLKEEGKRDFSIFKVALWQIMAGIIHAFYATGGPMLVYSLSRMNLSKSVFRATMCTVWFTFNAVLVVFFMVNGRINSESLKFTAYLLPVLPVAVFLGDWLHGRIKERNFRIFIYALLLVSGVTLVV